MRSRVSWLAVAALVAVGCFDVSFGDGDIVCGDAGCPPGFVCASDGTCRSSPLPDDAGQDAPLADALTDAVPDGGTSPDAGDQLACGTSRLLADDFEDGTRDPLWGNSYGSSTSKLEELGRVVFPLMPDTWSGYASTFDYDLTGGEVSIQALEVAPGADVYTYFGVRWVIPGDDPWARVIYRDGAIYAERRQDGVSSSVGDVQVYDPDAHRYWRVREAEGTIYWEHSADGVQWEVLASEAAWFDVTSVRLHFGMGTNRTDPPVGRASFDDFNAGVSEGAACPVSSVSDDFDDPQAAGRWAYVHEWSACTTQRTGGVAEISVAGSGYGECMYSSRKGYDLVGGATSVRVVDAAPGPVDYTYLGVSHPNGDHAHMLVYDGILYVTTEIDGAGTDHHSLTYDATAQAYWRIREAGGTLYAETSPDGQTWQTYEYGAVPFDLSQVSVYFGAGTDEAGAEARVARFDDFNLLP